MICISLCTVFAQRRERNEHLKIIFNLKVYMIKLKNDFFGRIQKVFIIKLSKVKIKSFFKHLAKAETQLRVFMNC